MLFGGGIAGEFSLHKFKVLLAIGEVGPDLLEGIGCVERERELAADCFELVGELELVGLINFSH